MAAHICLSCYHLHRMSETSNNNKKITSTSINIKDGRFPRIWAWMSLFASRCFKLQTLGTSRPKDALLLVVCLLYGDIGSVMVAYISLDNIVIKMQTVEISWHETQLATTMEQDYRRNSAVSKIRSKIIPHHWQHHLDLVLVDSWRRK